MNRFLFAAALFALPARADVPKDFLSEYDFSTTKVGEWVEHELTEDDEKTQKRMACVAEEGETLFIEVTLTYSTGTGRSSMLYGVNRKSGEVTAAWTEIGEQVSPVGIREPSAPPRSKREFESVEATNHGDDNQRAGDKTVPCQRIEIVAKLTASATAVKARLRLWTSSRVPFRYRSWGASGFLLGRELSAWKTKEPPLGGLVRVEGEAWPALKFRTKERTAKFSIRLLKFGTDAKADLYMRK